MHTGAVFRHHAQSRNVATLKAGEKTVAFVKTSPSLNLGALADER